MDFIGLIPQFGNVAFTILAFVVALSIIVAVHEYGHYIVGRWSGIHADVFSLGFGPVIFARKDRRGTRWQLALLPFGGFVKFKGDSDAASGKDGTAMSELPPEERRRTMHGAPLWARAATVAAGPLFNFALSIIVFSGFYLVSGVATRDAVVGALKSTPFEGQSLLPGDRITAIDGVPVSDLESLAAQAEAAPVAPVTQYEVSRGGQTLTLEGPYPFPPRADYVAPASAAHDVGVEEGDVVLAVDGKPIASFGELRDVVGNSGGKPLLLDIWRAGETIKITLVPRRMDVPLREGGFETRWLIGLSGGLVITPETRTPGVFEVIGLSASETWRIATTSLSGFWHIITGAISSCNIQGPIGIAESSGAAASQGVQSFIIFIAMLSTAVGLMNLFPIPVLDGGHLVFHAWEAVTGRPPTDRALKVLMGIGLTAILSLMIFAIGNDFLCP